MTWLTPTHLLEARPNPTYSNTSHHAHPRMSIALTAQAVHPPDGFFSGFGLVPTSRFKSDPWLAEPADWRPALLPRSGLPLQGGPPHNAAPSRFYSLAGRTNPVYLISLLSSAIFTYALVQRHMLPLRTPFGQPPRPGTHLSARSGPRCIRGDFTPSCDE